MLLIQAGGKILPQSRLFLMASRHVKNNEVIADLIVPQ